MFNFAVEVIKATKSLPNNIEFRLIIYQLIKCATSGGANYEEAQGAVSRADFTNKVGISLKEIREANYWIRTINAKQNSSLDFINLEKESEELKKILGSIYSKVSIKR